MNPSLPLQVHSKLRARLLDGSLPPGARLEYKKLAADLGVSTTPVREAVTQLASEGFVDLIPRLGAVVRELSHATAVELYEVREAVETYACAKAAERISPPLLEKVREQLAIMDAVNKGFAKSRRRSLDPDKLVRFLDADLRFHQTILAGSRNAALAKTVQESHIQVRVFFADRGIHDRERLALACAQHGRIFAALESGDGEAAARAMGEHVRESMRLTLDFLDAPTPD